MTNTQRVVRSIPDRSGNNYTKTSAGGLARASSAVKYMDQKEQTQLYTYEENQLRETDRLQAAERIGETTTKYQQHLTFTTQLPGELEVDERRAAAVVAQAVQERRPDADIYAVAVHQQEGGNVHVHICFGTDTTLRRGAEGDLVHFQGKAFELEKNLSRDLHLSPSGDRHKEPAGGRMLDLDEEDLKPQKERQVQWGMDY